MPDRKYRVIFMEMPLEEVIASQDAMLERLGRPKAGKRSNLARTYLSQIEQVKRVLARHDDRLSVMTVDYHRALADPERIAEDVNGFLGNVLNEAQAASAIDPSLRRQGAPGSNQPAAGKAA